MTRRTVSYSESAFQPWMLISGAGALVVLFALFSLGAQLVVSIRHRRALAVPAGDPWDGRTLEWSLPAPVPEWNFAHIPEVTARDAFWEAKRAGHAYEPPQAYDSITLPRNSAIGMIFGVLGASLGFALVWHVWWLALVSAVALAVTVIARSFATRTDVTLAPAGISASDRAFRSLAMQTQPVGREQEETAANRGRAQREVTA
jgi:cytochrome o ubiquinol oxidase subunit 1